MKSMDKNPFAGLPVTLVNDLLSKSGQLANKIYEPVGEIGNNRDKLREQLQGQNLIRDDSVTESVETPSSCGVDGYYGAEKLLTSDLVCSAAFAVEGLIPPSGKRQWDEPSHKSLFCAEKHHPETEKILRALMMEMKIELAAAAPQEVIFLNGSFGTEFAVIMETLHLALKFKGSTTGQEFINRIKTVIPSFETICGLRNSAKTYAGIPKNTTCNELVKKMQLPEHYEDTILLTILLSPGEFTSPVPVDEAALSRVKNIPIKDENFSAVRDRLVAELNKFRVLYYKPYEWTPVFRIETAQNKAEDSSQLPLLLSAVKYQCSTAGITDPFPLYYAGKTAQRLERAFPSLCKSTTSYIKNLHKENIGEIFSLLRD